MSGCGGLGPARCVGIAPVPVPVTAGFAGTALPACG